MRKLKVTICSRWKEILRFEADRRKPARNSVLVLVDFCRVADRRSHVCSRPRQNILLVRKQPIVQAIAGSVVNVPNEHEICLCKGNAEGVWNRWL